MFRDRTYESGCGWCVWRWTDVPTEDIRRLHLVKTPVGALCVHWLLKPDPAHWLHDHPVSFLSIILRGWYREERDGQIKTRRLFNFIRDTDQHRIVEVAPSTMTLCFMGPKTREWGVHTDRGFKASTDFYDKRCLVSDGPWHGTDDKTIEDCKSKFHHELNFRGNPVIP